jgi:hypothetical protein
MCSAGMAEDVVERTAALTGTSAVVGGAEFLTEALPGTPGVCGSAFLGGGIIGGGKSAAVGGELATGGKPACLSSSALFTTGSASSYSATP